MGDQVYQLGGELLVPVEPTGNLAIGWVPGTWVKISPTPSSNFSSAMFSVVRSDGIDNFVGFLTYGPQHNQPVQRLSDMFEDERRPNGDKHKDWTAKNGGLNFEFDKEGLLQKIGTRLATVAISNEGIFKLYFYEIYNKTERNAPGFGAALVYVAGDLLYVSENGLTTNEKETINSRYSGFMVFQKATDEEGDFIIIGEFNL